MNINSLITKDYERNDIFAVPENKPNSNPIAERVKLMQIVYLQRIMKKNAAKGYEKTKPIQTQFKPCPERSRMGQFQTGHQPPTSYLPPPIFFKINTKKCSCPLCETAT